MRTIQVSKFISSIILLGYNSVLIANNRKLTEKIDRVCMIELNSLLIECVSSVTIGCVLVWVNLVH